MVNQRIVDRFFAKTSTDHGEWFDGTKCVLWTASHSTKNGHGRFWDGARFWVAHRFAWAVAHGPAPDRIVVAHLCQNRQLCVNADHLELITLDEMIRRRVANFTPAETFRCCGQPRTPENAYPSSGGCRACYKVTQRNYRERRKQRAASVG